MANLAKHVQVAVGVITKNDKFFVCRRRADQHQGDKWEFPGGKIESGESAEHTLKRELLEEVGIEVTTFETLITIDFSYPDKNVSLHVFVVSEFTGEAHGAEGQESKWLSFNELLSIDFPEANRAILEAIAVKR